MTQTEALEKIEELKKQVGELEKHIQEMPTEKTPIELAIEKCGEFEGYCRYINIKISDNNAILLTLAEANNRWTISAFKWAIAFTEQNKGTYVCTDDPRASRQILVIDCKVLSR